MKCSLCKTELTGEKISVREMMFGLRETFTYHHCQSCGCLELLDPPSSMKQYYPTEYYAHQPTHDTERSRSGLTQQRNILTKRKNQVILSNSPLLRPAKILLNRTRHPVQIRWLLSTETRLSDPILDFGCGNGDLLLQFQRLGCTRLSGYEPFSEQSFRSPENIHFYHRSVEEIDETFQLIMLHHVFEHLSDPLDTLNTLRRMLRPGGKILIRTPVMGQKAWNLYREHWFQIDAPRHYFIHTERSINLLAQEAGFKMLSTTFDSTPMQFWASEQYKRDIPLTDKRSHYITPQHSLFDRNKLEQFTALTLEANHKRTGDQACFVLADIYSRQVKMPFDKLRAF